MQHRPEISGKMRPSSAAHTELFPAFNCREDLRLVGLYLPHAQAASFLQLAPEDDALGDPQLPGGRDARGERRDKLQATSNMFCAWTREELDQLCCHHWVICQPVWVKHIVPLLPTKQYLGTMNEVKRPLWAGLGKTRFKQPVSGSL